MAFVQRGKSRDEAVKNAGAQRQEMVFALASDLDQASGFEFPNVVRECGSGDGQGGERISAA